MSFQVSKIWSYSNDEEQWFRGFKDPWLETNYISALKFIAFKDPYLQTIFFLTTNGVFNPFWVLNYSLGFTLSPALHALSYYIEKSMKDGPKMLTRGLNLGSQGLKINLANLEFPNFFLNLTSCAINPLCIITSGNWIAQQRSENE